MERNTEPLGRFEYCLAVEDINRSIEYYEKVGFELVDGNPKDEGWAIMKCGNGVVSLYQNSMGGLSGKAVLNFRGGNIKKIVTNCKGLGLEVKKDFKAGPEGGGSATLLDPDGNEVFLDTAPDEPVYQFNVTDL